MRPLSTRLATAAHFVVRCQNRLPAFAKVRLKRDGMPDLVLSLKNVSRSGFMAETSAHIPAGRQVRLDVPYVGIVGAEVRWSHDNRMGCRLKRDFSFGQIARLYLFSAPHSLPAEIKILLVTIVGIAVIALR